MNIGMQKIREKEIGTVIEVEISRIRQGRTQPRKFFDREELVKLAKSVAQDGILQPLSVRRLSDGNFELIAGERRMRAAKMAGFSVVPCIELETSEQSSAVLSLVENIQRQSLQFFEEAQAIERLISDYGLTQEAAAQRLSVSQSYIANKLRILRLSDEVKAEIVRLSLTERHARAMLKLENDKQRLFLLSKISERGLNVEKTEQLIEAYLEKKQREESIKRRSGVFKDIRLFFNTVNKALEIIKLAGVDAHAQKCEREGCIEYTITIPTIGCRV